MEQTKEWGLFYVTPAYKERQLLPNFVRDQRQVGTFFFFFWMPREINLKSPRRFGFKRKQVQAQHPGSVRAAGHSWGFCMDFISGPGKTISVISLTLIVSILNLQKEA